MKLLQKFYLCLLALSFSTLSLKAACPTGDITFNTQAQIDAFPTTYAGCAVMPYSITIQEHVLGNITNLNGLSQLTAIGGGLRIVGNPALTNLTGLGTLTSIGQSLEIVDNAGLTSLTILARIT